MRKKPRLTYREIADQIFKMTGLDKEIVKAVMDAYAEITEEALLGQVEVPFGKLGYFSYKQISPMENYVPWHPHEGRYGEPYNRDGYQKSCFRFNAVWAGRQKEATRWPFGEENPMLELLDLDAINAADDEDEELEDGDE